jgi:hypothetical protein
VNGSRLRTAKSLERVSAGSRRTFGGWRFRGCGTTIGAMCPWNVEPTMTVTSVGGSSLKFFGKARRRRSLRDATWAAATLPSFGRVGS